MEQLAEKLTRYIIKKEIISKEEYELYRYGMLTGLEMALCMAICTIIAIYLKSFLEYIVLIAVFFSLRAYVGGIHLKHFASCLICSCSVITSLLIAANLFSVYLLVALGVTVITMFVISRLAPLATKENANDREQIIFFAKQRRRILIAIAILDIVFAILGCKILWSLITYTMLMILFSIILKIVKTNGKSYIVNNIRKVREKKEMC